MKVQHFLLKISVGSLYWIAEASLIGESEAKVLKSKLISCAGPRFID